MKTHDIRWDAEKIASFWNRQGTDDAMRDLYFSRQRGRSILRFVKKHIDLQGRVIDLGCGPGYLIDYLLEAGIECEGADLSAGSVAQLNQRLAANPMFRGARVFPAPTQVPFPEEYADAIFCLETLEHLLDEDLESYVSNLSTTLTPGGHLVVTVPYRENLERGKVSCPQCGCRFHKMQHVREFCPESLKSLLSRHGVSPLVCRPATLWPDPGIYLRSLKQMARQYRLNCPECAALCPCETAVGRNLLGKVRISSLFHLIFIGRKEQHCGSDASRHDAGSSH